MARPKPSTQLVEVASGEEAPRHRGALRGLHPEQDIIENARETVEEPSPDDEVEKKPIVKHTTRSTRNGGKPSPAGIYDAKFHPMDVVTRPNGAATRRHRSKSVPFADQESDDERESSPSDADMSGEDTDSSEDPLSSDTLAHTITPTPRVPHPDAARRSSRSEAKKFRNYNRNIHPQDGGIPGYKKHAAYIEAINTVNTTPSSLKPSKKRSSPADAELTVSVTEPARERRPRKKLKSIAQNIKPSKKSKAKSSKKQTKAKPARKAISRSGVENSSKDEATQSPRSPPKPMVIPDSEESDDEMFQQDENLLHHSDPSGLEEVVSSLIEQDEATSSSSGDMSSDTPGGDIVLDEGVQELQLHADSVPPPYIQDRYALEHDRYDVPMSEALEMMLEDHRYSGEKVALNIVKPYLARSLQGPETIEDGSAIIAQQNDDNVEGDSSMTAVDEGRELPKFASQFEDEMSLIEKAREQSKVEQHSEKGSDPIDYSSFYGSGAAGDE